MRGVVTLAAAFVIPDDTPHRDVLLLIAFTVTAGTLFLQGFSLPWLARRLHVPAPDPAADALARANLLTQASQAGLAALDALDEEDPHDVSGQIRARLERRDFAAWEQLGTGDGETPTETYARRRRMMIDVERGRVLEARSTGTVPHEVIAQVLAMLDVEESMLDYSQRERGRLRGSDDAARAGGGRRLRAPAGRRARGPTPRLTGRVRGLRPAGHRLGPPAAVPELREGGLLRLLAGAARERALRAQRAPGDALGRAGGELALVLRGPAHRVSHRGRWQTKMAVPGKSAPRSGDHWPQTRSRPAGHSGSTRSSSTSPAATTSRIRSPTVRWCST